ncbi:efflux RND transporter periplasmic adaptor subunit [Sphingobacterium sp. N143]|uniref:efflux RND transporter periplasmic adaptor subunit n=1 Tax=Sphingobacterium sp. N143 TaxID=2746727 RepID=UPI002576813D|nr:efflux RND transporter periplasmic adaptor subunit [Sphingobacterium sp. N143]MDM1292999.1 efflux RND transporter periplasmic adaptor subunit [Sphingobacterium sp. N143]
MAQRTMTLKPFLTFITAATLLSSCGGTQEQPQEQAVTVDFIELSPATAETEKKYPGTLEGTVNVDVKAQVTGYLDQIYVKEGDYVTAGQPLFKIKADVYNEQVNNSRAAYQAALSAEQNAKLEIEKIKPLVEGKVYTELQLKTAEANYAAARAQVAQAQAAVGSAQINARFTLINAPVSGYIGRIPNRIGNLITAADATPLTTLSEINTVNVYFALSEADFISFMRDHKSNKQEASLILADGSVYDHSGKVELASGNIDKNTGSITLKASFPNPEKVLRSGGSAKVVLKKAHDHVLLVPMAAVKDIQDRYFVYVIGDKNKIAMKQIEIAGHTATAYLLKSGLTAGEKIVMNRIDMLNDGMQVQPTKK